MLDSWLAPGWTARAIEQLQERGDAEAALILLRSPGVDVRGSDGALLRHETVSNTLARIALQFLTDRVWRSTAQRTVDLQPLVPGVRIRTWRAAPGRGGTLVLTDSDAEAARAEQLDFILRFGSGTLGGTILDAARHGVWSFHHGDECRHLGQPCCFWEIYDGNPVVAVTLERLASSRFPGTTLRKGYFAVVQGSYARTLDRVLLGSAELPALTCRELRRGKRAPYPPTSGTTAPLRDAPTTMALGRFLLRLVRARIASAVRQSLRHDHWNIGIVDAPVESLAVGRSSPLVRWAPERRGRYAADPFGWPEGDGYTILFEDYAHATGTATIARIDLDVAGRWSEPETTLDIGSHLSYPFVMTVEGRRMVMPEARGSGSVAIYEFSGGERPWRLHALLLERADISDPTLVWHESRWWLFGVRNGSVAPDTQLMLWFAHDLTGPWREHPSNPVKTDVRSARPAGPLFRSNGQLFRPAQDCSSSYGARVRILRVVTLDEDHYEEEEIGVVEPRGRGQYPLGLHTMTGLGPITIVDGKRATWSISATRRVVSQRFRMVAKRPMH
jgi:hypothetical protein